MLTNDSGVLVVGALSGIGRSIAVAFAREGAAGDRLRSAGTFAD